MVPDSNTSTPYRIAHNSGGPKVTFFSGHQNHKNTLPHKKKMVICQFFRPLSSLRYWKRLANNSRFFERLVDVIRRHDVQHLLSIHHFVRFVFLSQWQILSWIKIIEPIHVEQRSICYWRWTWLKMDKNICPISFARSPMPFRLFNQTANTIVTWVIFLDTFFFRHFHCARMSLKGNIPKGPALMIWQTLKCNRMSFAFAKMITIVFAIALEIGFMLLVDHNKNNDQPSVASFCYTAV